LLEQVTGGCVVDLNVRLIYCNHILVLDQQHIDQDLAGVEVELRLYLELLLLGADELPLLALVEHN